MNRVVLRAFYGVVIAVSVVGAVDAAAKWLEWPMPAPVLAVLTVELGGIVLAHHADGRRQLGEAAMAARLLSGAIAVAAVVMQVAGHRESTPQALFFGVVSSVGYLTYLISSEAERRDALRAAGLLAEVPPSYGLLQWVREPGVTRRARVLAQERAAQRLEALRRRKSGEQVDVPARLDALASLAAARQERDDRQRREAIATVLRRKIRKQVDRDTADIAVAVYDLDEIAARLTARADYGVLTDLVGADLAPARLAGAHTNANANDAHDSDAHEVRGVDVTERLFAAHGVPVEDPTRAHGDANDGPDSAAASGGTRKVESASGTSAGLPSRSWADAAGGRALLPIVPRTPATPAGAVNGDANGAHDDGPVAAVVRIPEQNDGADDSAEVRAAAVQEWLTVVRSGQSLSGAELGRRHGMSPRWGQARVREAREVLGRELPGQLAIEAAPVNGHQVDELVTASAAS